MPNTIVTKVVSERFARWAGSLSNEEQATLAEWMGVADQEDVRADLQRTQAERPGAEHEDVARRLIRKVRHFSEVELDPAERRMLNLLLTPGLTNVLGARPPAAESAAGAALEVLPRGLSGVLPTAISAAVRNEGVRVVELTPDDSQNPTR